MNKALVNYEPYIFFWSSRVDSSVCFCNSLGSSTMKEVNVVLKTWVHNLKDRLKSLPFINSHVRFLYSCGRIEWNINRNIFVSCFCVCKINCHSNFLQVFILLTELQLICIRLMFWWKAQGAGICVIYLRVHSSKYIVQTKDC